MIKSVILLGAIVLSACAARVPELPKPSGNWVHLNPDKYPTDQNDITAAPHP